MGGIAEPGERCEWKEWVSQCPVTFCLLALQEQEETAGEQGGREKDPFVWAL